MSLARVALLSAIGFIGGIVLATLSDSNQLVTLVFLILALFVITVFWGRMRFFVAGLFILAVLLGMWRVETAEALGAENDIAPHFTQEVSWKVQVFEEPELDSGHQELLVQPEGMEGRLLLWAPRYPEYEYGDVLLIRGVVEEPPAFEDFDYRAFLESKDVYGVVFRPQVELVEQDKGSVAYHLILSLKERFREVVRTHLSPPHSEILSAMLLGDKGRMSGSLKEQLNVTGVRHITAVSGMHVAILSGILMSFLLGAGLWRSHATVLAAVFIVLFVVLTGFQSSAIRAGLMGGVVLFSQNVGRAHTGIRTLVFVAVLMLAFNPLLLQEVGFQLSFLAVLGIILLLPLLRELLSFIPTSFQLRDIVGMTIAAQVFTLPVLLFHFGGFSVVSILTNLLIVPLLPFILGLGFLFIVAGAVWEGFGFLLSFPVFFLLDYLVRVVELVAKVPGAFLASSVASWVVLALIYVGLGYIAWRFVRTRSTFPY